MKTYDIVTVGAGASGLACAVEAARRGGHLRIAVLERSDRVGKKILVTGNGRCNLTNRSLSADRYTGNYECYASAGEGLSSAEEFFGSMGLLTFADAEGRVYPVSNQASSVLNVLRRELALLGVEEICGFEAADLRRDGEAFLLTAADGRTVRARQVLIACGTPAGQKNGSGGRLLEALKRLGHPVLPFRAALAPLPTDPALTRSLKGQRVRGSVVLERNGQKLGSASGEVQFTDGSLSGICVMDLSVLARTGDLLCLDLLPGMDLPRVEEYLLRQIRKGGEPAELLTGMTGRPMGQFLLRRAGLASVTEADAARLAAVIKRLEFPVTGESDPARAQVCAGGIDCRSVDPRSLESRSCPGLFFAGEILGVTGCCGGFNLDWAWRSGRTAGRSMAEQTR